VAGSGAAAEPAALRLTVCLAPHPDLAVLQARSLATEIFQDVGVTIVWDSRAGACPADGIRALFWHRTPDTLHPGAFGRAVPADGTRIEIFYDRVRVAAPGARLPSLLAHVLAHEIAHVAQAVDHHAPEGLMKAHWVSDDVAGRVWRTLPFTAMDVELLRRGLGERQVRFGAGRPE
ncbi:MAG TPA: hypothetical protein VMM93_13740, partial [Vicinamibacterales bacterium]|nr:hypothetical protein [Vicinamibacterales bacterium]